MPRRAHSRFYRDPMTVLRDSTARTRELGAELRKIREAARYTGRELAFKLGWSQSKVSRMETGDREFSEVDAAVYAAFCGAMGDQLQRVRDLAQKVDDQHWLHARGERIPDELRSLIVQESTAQILVKYDPLVVPGLTQTENYARTLFKESDLWSEEAIELRVQVRMDRQRLLARERPPQITFYIHENALRTPVGSRSIMHEQILHLLLASSAPQLRLRVLPSSKAAGIGGCGPFTWMAHREHNPVIYTEHLTTSLFLETPEDTRLYRRTLDRLAALALDEGQSREFLATLATEYEREEGEPSDLAEEQLQQRWER